ncbi:MAG: aromatic ring-hydroxylating dioxygenase subunit alpha [Planctomycetes bacterium]|nr:aromatic ring-hydroxylating dioxygenase subunit alpha [Planctomycetota bacterium]
MSPVVEVLYDMWYLAIPGRRLHQGQTVGVKLLGRPILVGRAADGSVFALSDLCPHRGIPLSFGRFDGREVECCYHGWRFDCGGVCTHIPSLLPTQTFELGRIRVTSFPCREVQGNVWVYVPADDASPAAVLPEIPRAPEVDECHLRLVERCVYPCSADQAVVSLMDPAHGPFVHASWWWRSRGSMHEKAKAFAPSHLGFTMVRHRPSANSRAYRLLGSEVSTEIRFELPGTRIEHIRFGRHHLCGVTTVTPRTATEVEVHQLFYWTVPGLVLLRPLLRRFVRTFLRQDRDVLDKQRQGLNDDPQLMLINDADRPARWYYQLKKELHASRAEGRPFRNPVPHVTLGWRT